jgi:mono/diheme cytochrome c family protein
MIRACFYSVISVVFLAGVSGGTENSEVPPAAKRDVDFVKDIRPIFKDHCIKCHGPNKQRGDFRLDEKAAALKGGENFAPAIIPGKGDESPLVRFAAGVVDGMEMPPEGEKRLSKDQIGLLRAWIDQGAKWPDDAPKQNPPAEHWSFQKLTRPLVPTASDANQGWTRNPIDPFIAAKLHDLSAGVSQPDSPGLAPSPEADRLTLIRRAYLDLIGLPVPIQDVQGFVDDSRPDAYERLIDRLLASPHFGERWARHWLDVVKFAESDGFETNQPRPNAWPYRDYVIRSFNEDKPFDRFLFEQIAGDSVGVDEATGFLVAGAWDRVKSPDPGLTAQQRADELHDMVSTTGSALMGLTVGCARCHNHKFDPVSQADYYAMKAVFAGVQHGERPLKPADANQRTWNLDTLRARLNVIDDELTRFEPLANVGGTGAVARHRSSVSRRINVERFLPIRAKFVRFFIEATTGSEPCIDELEVFETTTNPDTKPRNVARSNLGTIATSSSNLPGFEIHQLPYVNDGRYGNSASWISNEPGRGWVMLEFAESVEIDRILWSRDRPESGQFQDRIPTKYRIEAGMTIDSLKVVASSDDRIPLDGTSIAPPDFSWLNPDDRVVATRLATERQLLRQRLQAMSSEQMVYAGRFATPEPTFRLHRGDPMQRREPALPGGLSDFGGNWKLDETTPDSDRRTALANWIISSEHPLTTRVIANRLWQHHFGQGIVATPSDFGRNGVPPSHPELLNWLAAEIDLNSSLKRIHRSIITSATYRQSSQARDIGMAQDAASRLLWRYPPRRLEAESIRDSILVVAGNLDDRMYGAGFDLFEPNTNYVKVYNSKREFGPAEWRRMVYQAKPRMQLDEIFGQFDCPDAGQITPRRTSSITSLQALNLLNSRFIIQQSARFASRLRDEAGDHPSPQMQRAFELAFQRKPAEDELAAAIALVQSHGLEAACRALLNANEFLFVF